MVKSTIKLNLYMHPTEFAGEPFFNLHPITNRDKKKTEKVFQPSPFLYAVRDSNPGPID